MRAKSKLFAAAILLLFLAAGVFAVWKIPHPPAGLISRLFAEFGSADAQFNLALAYAEGDGVPKDFIEAVKWLRKAGEQGNVNAQYGLAAR